MTMHQLLLAKFPSQNHPYPIVRGALLVHHGGNKYQKIFNQINAIYRKHLVSHGFNTQMNEPITQHQLPSNQAKKLSLITSEAEGADIAKYAEYLLFDLHVLPKSV